MDLKSKVGEGNRKFLQLILKLQRMKFFGVRWVKSSFIQCIFLNFDASSIGKSRLIAIEIFVKSTSKTTFTLKTLANWHQNNFRYLFWNMGLKLYCDSKVNFHIQKKIFSKNPSRCIFRRIRPFLGKIFSKISFFKEFFGIKLQL